METKIVPKEKLVRQKEAFERVKDWILLQDEIHKLEENLAQLRRKAALLETDPAVQATKGVIRGAKRKTPKSAPEEEKKMAKQKKTDTARKRLEKMVRIQESAPKNPNAGKKYPDDIRMELPKS
jgi:predicted ATP-dependent endonuclease of OLD family